MRAGRHVRGSSLRMRLLTGTIPKSFRSMRVIADTCGRGWEIISMPVLGGAANDPKIVLPAVNRSRDLFRSHLLRRCCYRWPFRINGTLSDRWHLDHVFLVKRGLGDCWRSRSHLLDLLLIKLGLGVSSRLSSR